MTVLIPGGGIDHRGASAKTRTYASDPNIGHPRTHPIWTKGIALGVHRRAEDFKRPKTKSRERLGT